MPILGPKIVKKGPHLAHVLFFLKNVLLIKLEILNVRNLVIFGQLSHFERKNVGLMWKFLDQR